jgi:hypothetical protein
MGELEGSSANANGGDDGGTALFSIVTGRCDSAVVGWKLVTRVCLAVVKRSRTCVP